MAELEPRSVELKGGLRVSIAALQLAIDLEMRDFTLWVHDGLIYVDPRERLTNDEMARIRRYRWHLLAILAYQAPDLLGTTVDKEDRDATDSAE